jgi:hypothetical protein
MARIDIAACVKLTQQGIQISHQKDSALVVASPLPMLRSALFLSSPLIPQTFFSSHPKHVQSVYFKAHPDHKDAPKKRAKTTHKEDEVQFPSFCFLSLACRGVFALFASSFSHRDEVSSSNPFLPSLFPFLTVLLLPMSALQGPNPLCHTHNHSLAHTRRQCERVFSPCSLMFRSLWMLTEPYSFVLFPILALSSPPLH